MQPDFGGGLAWPGLFLTGHRRAGPKRAGWLVRFATPNCQFHLLSTAKLY